MNTKQEQWMDDIMGSLQQMQKAPGNPYLHTRVMAKIRQPFLRQPLQLKWVFTFSAVFVCMFLLNLLSWNGTTDTNNSAAGQPVDIEMVINEYELNNQYTSIP